MSTFGQATTDEDMLAVRQRRQPTEHDSDALSKKRLIKIRGGVGPTLGVRDFKHSLDHDLAIDYPASAFCRSCWQLATLRL